jgi:hypothetical protein
MAAIEVRERAGIRRVELELDAHTIGSDPGECDVVVEDPTVSSVHARLERVGGTWEIRDLGSLNGTFVGTGRVLLPQTLRDGNEVRVGRTTLVFRDPTSRRVRRTEAIGTAPDNITPTERKVLLELCRPLLEHNAFVPPSTERAIADRLVVKPGAVRAHLLNLYDKFGIVQEASVNRRTVLANEAVSLGVVTIDQLQKRVRDDGLR